MIKHFQYKIALNSLEAREVGCWIIKLSSCDLSSPDISGFMRVRGESKEGLSSVETATGFGALYSMTSSAFDLSTTGFSGSGGLTFEWKDFVHP